MGHSAVNGSQIFQVTASCVVILGLSVAALYMATAGWYLKQAGRHRRDLDAEPKPWYVKFTERIS